MPEIGTSGSMSGDGKRSVAEWPKPSRHIAPPRDLGLTGPLRKSRRSLFPAGFLENVSDPPAQRSAERFIRIA